jgi:hypothetical protein
LLAFAANLFQHELALVAFDFVRGEHGWDHMTSHTWPPEEEAKAAPLAPCLPLTGRRAKRDALSQVG